jgi:thiol-disulfide isomerase/thioredoxin
LLAALAVLALGAEAQSWVKKEKAPEKSKGFIVSFEQAKKEAAAFKQPIFAFFTGSDWCGWCKKLRAEALDTPAFEKFAADNLILLEIDFPRGKELPSSVKKQNDALAAQYQAKGFPTVCLLDADGKELGRTGYQEGGAEAYVKHIKELLEKAGVKTADKPDAPKAQSAYEKMKAQKAARAAAGEAK